MVSRDTKPKRHYARFLLTAFVVSLAFVPFDIGSALLWSLGFAAVLWSVIQLMGSGVQLLAGDRLHWPTAVLAPMLTVAFFFLAILAARISFSAATEFSARTALEIQGVCRASKCPATIEGWRKDQFGCASLTRSGYFTRYYVCYVPSEDGSSFSLRLRRHIDYSIVWKGGSNVALQRRDDVG